jgi:hypothetical protein
VPEHPKRDTPCGDCHAFLSAYSTACEHYSALTASLHKLAGNGEFSTTRYQKLKTAVGQVRDEPLDVDLADMSVSQAQECSLSMATEHFKAVNPRVLTSRFQQWRLALSSEQGYST